MTAVAPSGTTEHVSLAELVLRHQRTGRGEHLDELLERLDRLICSRVRRLITTNQSFEDCYQEARIAALGAIERWSPDGGASVTTFVTRSVDGAVKRYFRDATWDLHVTRGHKEKAMRVKRFRALYERDHGRTPSVHELADVSGMSEEEVLEGQAALQAYHIDSIDLTETSGGRTLADRLTDDPNGPDIATLMDLREGVRNLATEARRILYLYFYCDKTQEEIAQDLGCSQMQVSRLLRRALARLRAREHTLA